MYTDIVMDHLTNPRNMGEIENPDGVGQIGNPVCGDIMRITIRVKDSVLEDIKFKTFGCGAAIATSSAVTQMMRGKTIKEALELTNRKVAEELGGLPANKMHCSNLAADALHLAIKDYLTKNPGAEPGIDPESIIVKDDHHDDEGEEAGGCSTFKL
ncbi:MAG TPA: Fe-S cluster assembly scaffold protein NifU [Bacillota bacterium]|nr:Fe-S cluster assembly scaffold protein NifU [Bacillota bacterium]HOA15440.1 Fe-S cluster assembly scaffold protein NifU [Bacillota bacterium]HOG53388.1 Fe-S cluster assembly scaffold protein NifU [Bacillota bacterium]